MRYASSPAQVGAPQLGSNSLCGVSWLEDQELWQAALHHEGSSIDMGHFVTQEEAACAYDAAALVIGGDHPLNFPSQVGKGGVHMPVCHVMHLHAMVTDVSHPFDFHESGRQS